MIYQIERNKIKIGLFMLVICLYYLLASLSSTKEVKTQVIESQSSSSKVVVKLSKLLRDAKQKIGQLNCEQGKRAESGGWCSSISGANSTEHLTDESMVVYLSKFLKGKLN